MLAIIAESLLSAYSVYISKYVFCKSNKYVGGFPVVTGKGLRGQILHNKKKLFFIVAFIRFYLMC